MLFDSFHFDADAGILYLRAYVEDVVQVSPATRFDPPEYGTALCEGSVFWDSDVPPTEHDAEQWLEVVNEWIPCEL